MNEVILKVLIKNRGIDIDGSWLMNAEYTDLQVLANKIEEAINYKKCCEGLKCKEEKKRTEDYEDIKNKTLWWLKNL
jgi:hypothetical protein